MNILSKVIAKLGLYAMLVFTFPMLAMASDGVLIKSPELLDAESAFQVVAKMKNANAVELTYTIADGYYLYRKRFSFTAEVNSVAAKNPTKVILPVGKIKQDATFGRVETYRGTVRVLLPMVVRGKTTSASTVDQLIRIHAVSQGCADAGVCYPPLAHDVTIHSDSRETITAQIIRPQVASDVAGNTFSPKALPPVNIVKSTGSVSDLIRKNP